MSKLADLRQKAQEKLDALQRQRDEYHQLKNEGKPQSELDQRFQAFSDTKKQYDGLIAEIDEEKRSGEMDSFIDEQQRARKTNRGAKKPGRDDFDGRTAGDETDEDPEKRSGPTEEQRVLALHAWARRQFDLPLKRKHTEAVKACRMRAGKNLTFSTAPTQQFRDTQRIVHRYHPEDARYRLLEQEKRAMSALQGSTGGLAVPQGFVRRIEVNQLFFGAVLQTAEVIRTQRGDDMPWPTSDDTSNEGELVSENTSVDGSTEPSIGSVVMKAYKSHSKMVKVPVELIEDWDAGPEFVDWLADALGERLGRHRNRLYTTGTGNSQPEGIIPGATVGKTAASSTAITGSEVIELLHSIDPAYRQPGFGVMMHDSIWTQVLLLQDGNNQFLHTMGLAEGARPQLRGFPVFFNNHMDSALATNNKVILAGMLSKYKVREVRQVRLKRLDERYADNDQVAFDAFFRHDGHLLDAGTAPVKVLQMA